MSPDARRPLGSATGRLVLVGTPIGNLGDLAPRAVEALAGADVIAAEDTRRTRALLTHAGVRAGSRLRSLHARNEAASAPDLLDRMRGGLVVAYVTDAGMPGVSDPGERIVRACVDAGIPVEVVPGPSAMLTALVVSGLPTARFAFEGFLPRSGRSRRDRLALLATEGRTVVLYESPRRLAATLADLAAALGADRRCAVARELTKVYEEVRRGTLGELAAAAAAEPAARGEHVVVVGPATGDAGAPGDAAVDAALAPLLAGGMRASEAAASVAAALGVSKRRAYDRVHAGRERS